jgi:hypothetical protein
VQAFECLEDTSPTSPCFPPPASIASIKSPAWSQRFSRSLRPFNVPFVTVFLWNEKVFLLLVQLNRSQTNRVMNGLVVHYFSCIRSSPTIKRNNTITIFTAAATRFFMVRCSIAPIFMWVHYYLHYVLVRPSSLSFYLGSTARPRRPKINAGQNFGELQLERKRNIGT